MIFTCDNIDLVSEYIMYIFIISFCLLLKNKSKYMEHIEINILYFSILFRYVFWYHNERMINYDSERGISVTTTPGRRTHSQLSIQKADVSDSGNYTCAPSSALPASIHVFVSGRVINFKMLIYI